MEVLFVFALLPFFPILVYQINHRPFALLLFWLAIGPFASNVITAPGSNPFFAPKATVAADQGENSRAPKGSQYMTESTTIRISEILEPTRLLLGAFLAVFILNGIIRKKPLHLDPVDLSMLGFSLIVIAGAFRSTRMAFGIRVAADAFIIPFISYYVTKKLVTSEDHFRRLVKAFAHASIAIIIACVVERLASSGFYTRMGGPFKNPNALSTVLTMPFVMALAECLYDKHALNSTYLFRPFARYFAVCLIPIVILWTWSRGSWLGFLLGVGAFILLNYRTLDASKKFLGIGLIFVFSVVLVAGFQMPGPADVLEERVTNKAATVYARLGAWLVIVNQIMEAPVFGIGLNDLREVLSTNRIYFLGRNSLTHPHNSYLAITGELGVSGLVAYLAVVLGIARFAIRLHKKGLRAVDRLRGTILIAGMAAYLVPALFANTLYITNMSHVYMYVFMGGLAGLYDRGRATSHVANRWRRRPMLSHLTQASPRTRAIASPEWQALR